MEENCPVSLPGHGKLDDLALAVEGQAGVMAVDTFGRRRLASRGLGGRWLCRGQHNVFAQGDDAALRDKLWTGLYVHIRDRASVAVTRATGVGVGVNQLRVEHARQVLFHDALQAGQGFYWEWRGVLEGMRNHRG